MEGADRKTASLAQAMMEVLDRLSNGESFDTVVEDTGITARVAGVLQEDAAGEPRWNQLVNQQGWNENSQLAVMWSFLREQKLAGALAQHAAEQVTFENGENVAYAILTQEDIARFIAAQPGVRNIVRRDFGSSAEVEAYRDGIDAVDGAEDVVAPERCGTSVLLEREEDESDETTVDFNTEEEAEAFELGVRDALQLEAPFVITADQVNEWARIERAYSEQEARAAAAMTPRQGL